MVAHRPSLVLFVVGVGIWLLPLARLARRERATRGLVRAMGRVVGLEPVEHLIANTELLPTWVSSTRYRPIVEFTTASGEVHQCAGLQSLPEGALRSARSSLCGTIPRSPTPRCAIPPQRAPERSSSRHWSASAASFSAWSPGPTGGADLLAADRRLVADTASRRVEEPSKGSPDMLVKRTWKRRTMRGQIVACVVSVSLIALVVSLTACSPSGPPYTLAHDGGYRVTLRASCPPTVPDCDLGSQRAAAIPLLSRRQAAFAEVKDAVVRANGADGIVVELPRVTDDADLVHLLTSTGAVAFVDTGETSLAIGADVSTKTCFGYLDPCRPGQFLVVFTGDEINPDQVSVQTDSSTGQQSVRYEFVREYQRQFAAYTHDAVGHYLAITVDAMVIASEPIQEEIDTSGEIGVATADDARRLAAYLESGPLPVLLMVVSNEHVTPSA
jgi:hypothetical protein